MPATDLPEPDPQPLAEPPPVPEPMPVAESTPAADRRAEADARAQRYYRRLRRVFPLLLVLVALVYTLTIDLVPSESMEPTLKPGDHILTLRAWVAYPMHRVPKRGDVVLFELPPTDGASHGSNTANAADRSANAPAEPEGRRQIGVFRTQGEILVKRVIGLPGETVLYNSGRVLVNGKPIADAHQTLDTEGFYYPYAGDTPVRLKSDELFVLGDNRANSDDSRFIGPIKVKSVIGRCLRVLYHTKPPADN